MVNTPTHVAAANPKPRATGNLNPPNSNRTHPARLARMKVYPQSAKQGDMHTTEAFTGSDFEYRLDGQAVSRTEVLPAIAPDARVGVVMADGVDGVGAGNFILSCVTAFYDHLRETKGEFFEYPDFYTFQTTTDPANFGMLDIYPEHKNVAVESDTESLLRAINDRAITILLVPDGRAQPPEV